MPDSTTATFLLTLVIAFVVIKYVVLSERTTSSSNASRTRTNNDSANTSTSAATRTTRLPPPEPREYRRPVTQSMIEVVQTLAPDLTVEQIRYDLQRTGNVETTVDRYLSQGTLPFPPNYTPPERTNSHASSPTSSASSSKTNLINRYNLQSELSNEEILKQPVEKIKWTQSKQDRQEQLKRQQREMILRARKKMEMKDKGL
jgi:coupling of ubiquitin conjugation to ER degradation protein 1